MAQMIKRPRGDGKVSYRIRWRYGGTRTGEWQSVTFQPHEQAQAKTFKAIVESRRHLLHDNDPEVRDRSILTGIKPAPQRGGITFGEVADRYIASRTRASEQSRAKYADIVRVHLAGLAARPIADITREDVIAVVNRITDAGKSAASPFDLLRSVMKYAVNADPPLRTGNPCTGVRLPRKRKRTETFLTHEEGDVLLAACVDGAREMVETMLYTGLRIGEVRALRVRDLRFGRHPELTVRETITRAVNGKPQRPGGTTKSEAGLRTIPLDPDTAAMLREHVKGKKPDQFVFTNPKTGTFWRESTWIGTCWEPTRARAATMGLTKHPRLHDLRHTHASWLLSDGVPLLVVSRRLGHESIDVTADTYGHIQPEADDVVRAALAKRRDTPPTARSRGLRVVP